MFRFSFLFLLTTIRLSAQLNSAYDEQSPVLHPGGMELFFTISHHPLNVSGRRDLGDIWVSQWENGKWSSPALARGLINNGGYNAVLGFSADGQEMFLYGHYSSDGGASGSQGISVARRTAGGWSLPNNENLPYFQNKSVATGGYVTPEKSVFIYSADARGTHGNEDLYVSFNDGKQWTEPENLGTIINTKNQELTPWLSADTKTLYFSSNQEPTLGSFDVYSSERLDDTWMLWSQPQNSGASISSVGRELFYHSFSGRTFFTSTFNSDGYGDIREIVLEGAGKDTKLNDSVPATTTMIVVEPSTEEKLQTKLFGKVTNSATGDGVLAKIVFHGGSVIASSSTGRGLYEINLEPKLLYTVRVEATGYIGLFEKIDLSNQQLQQLEINFKLQPVEVGVSINLKSVLFKQSTPELLTESYDELDMVVEFLKTNPTVEIELGGHTDSGGNTKLNFKLSEDRVTRVKNYITEKGIVARRIKGVGYGGSKPIASNKTEEGKRLNRRVEFRIVKE